MQPPASTNATDSLGPRVQMIARVVFYVLTLTAAALAVFASVAGGRAGSMLMGLSWYFIVAGVVAFLLMLLFNLLLRDESPTHRAGPPDASG